MTESITAPDTISATSVLDVKDLHNPMPLLRSKQLIAGMRKGEIVQVITSNAASGIDFSVWCQNTQHEYLGEKNNDGAYSFYIKIG